MLKPKKLASPCALERLAHSATLIADSKEGLAMTRPGAVIFALALGSAIAAAVPAVFAQDSSRSQSEVRELPAVGVPPLRVRTTREEHAGQTVERSVVEGPGVRGDSTVLFETVDETVRRGTGTSRRTRSDYVNGANGRLQLVATLDEQRTDRPDGGHSIVRDFSEPDVNGGSRVMRREQVETVRDGEDRFRTRIEIARPAINAPGFAPIERVEAWERRDRGQLIERESTTYGDLVGRSRWDAIERRVLSRKYSDGAARSVEIVYKPEAHMTDGSGLLESERIETTERTEPGGRVFETREVFTREVNRGGAPEPTLVRRIEITHTARADGGRDTTHIISERRDNRMLVVERMVEYIRPDGDGGTVIEQETERLDVNGRFQTVSVSRARDSAR
jgi:hypothetical protein